ncbi:ABC transporter substrate-binding protein [Altericista sp. CCNU0014]|uniref:ABC transporter substrate-binding protein n=1 Tax=Altericista sp. CCNU0014 TaxID=3082949 RepID=UPI00384BB441
MSTLLQTQKAQRSLTEQIVRIFRRPSNAYRSSSLFFLCLALTTSCAKSTPPGGGTGSDRLVIGTTAKFRTLDPADSYEVFSGNLLYNLGDRLYDYEKGSGKLTPKLATALPKVSADGLVYTIPLRKGVKFHDGTPFDAKAMAFSLNRFMANGGNPSGLLSDPVKSVTATGESELTITLKKPFAGFPNLLAFSGLVPVSPKVYKKGVGQFLPNQFVGTGPYKLVKVSGDSIRLEVNDRYWDAKPTNKGVNIQIFSSPANLFNAFRTGSIDIAFQSLDPDQIQALENDAKKGDWQAISSPSNFITFLVLNIKDEALSKVKVRQALAAMVNRDVLNDRVFRGQAESLYTLVPTIFTGISQPVFKAEQQKLGRDRIRSLLKESGYTPGKPLKLNLWYRSNLTSDGVAAATIKAMVGQGYSDVVQLDVSSVDSATAYKNLDKGTYPMFMLDWAGDYYDPDTYLQPFLACEKGSIKTGCQKGQSQSWGSFFYSDRANKLIDQQRQARDPKQRLKPLKELQTIVAKEVPYIPLWQKKDYVFAQKGINGIQLQPSQQFPFWMLSKP